MKKAEDVKDKSLVNRQGLIAKLKQTIIVQEESGFSGRSSLKKKMKEIGV